MRQPGRAPAALAIAFPLLVLSGCASDGNTADQPDAMDASAVAATDGPNPLRNAYFGDLHVHTRFSFDAYLFGTRTNPDDAYRFAKGEAITHASGHQIQLGFGSLDFQAVTDHGFYLGYLPAMDTPGDGLYDTSLGAELRELGSNGGFVRALQAMRSGEFADLPEDASNAAVQTAWQAIIDAAEAHNEPGVFTTFIGYEYTSSSDDSGNLHRNVIFQGSEAPPRPFARTDSRDPEDLWLWLDGLRAQGIEGLAIPHNSNGSNGHMFKPRDRRRRAARPPSLRRAADAQRTPGRDDPGQGHLGDAPAPVAERRVGRTSRSSPTASPRSSTANRRAVTSARPT